MGTDTVTPPTADEMRRMLNVVRSVKGSKAIALSERRKQIIAWALARAIEQEEEKL